jgi:DNA-binding transcriptional regulator YhcF (GntR family)
MWCSSGSIIGIVQLPFEVMNPDDSSPLYRQLARDLERDLLAGRYSVDQALASVRVLAKSLQVSRIAA